MIITDDEELYYKTLMFADKNFNRLGKEIVKNVPYLAPNYRMNELTAAVAIAQLDKVEDICAKRKAYGDKLHKAIQNAKGLEAEKILPDCECSYWFYMARINEEELGTTMQEFVDALTEEGVTVFGGYIPSCVYQYDMFKNKTVFPGDTNYPFDGTFGRTIEYKDGDCPNAEEIVKKCIRFPVNEFFTEQDLEETINGINKVCAYFNKNK